MAAEGRPKWHEWTRKCQYLRCVAKYTDISILSTNKVVKVLMRGYYDVIYARALTDECRTGLNRFDLGDGILLFIRNRVGQRWVTPGDGCRRYLMWWKGDSCYSYGAFLWGRRNQWLETPLAIIKRNSRVVENKLKNCV